MSKVDESRTAKVKTGGRVAGTPNKRSQEIQDKLDALGCDPIEGMALIAKEALEIKDYPLAGNMFKELAQYIAPKRKAIEHGIGDGSENAIASILAQISGDSAGLPTPQDE